MDGPQTHALADRLDAQLTGSPIERIDVPPDRWQANVVMMNCVGQVIQRVHARGQWLLIDFSHGYTWMCQFVARSRGDLIVPPGPPKTTRSPNPPPAPKARRIELLLRLTLDRGTALQLWGRPVLLIVPTPTVAAHDDFRALGPDPIVTDDTRDGFVDAFAARVRDAGNRTLASALLDSTIVAGIGNALKCEALFAARLRPSVKVSDLLASQIRNAGNALATICTQATADARAARPRHHAVYDRAGDPCESCGQPILADHSGADGRMSWYCPSCQTGGDAPRLF
jgi:formamidopyrimidine-DNA glycosylase